jgi:hypothetical protein
MFYGVNKLMELSKMAIQQRTTQETQLNTADKYLATSIRDQQEIG